MSQVSQSSNGCLVIAETGETRLRHSCSTFSGCLRCLRCLTPFPRIVSGKPLAGWASLGPCHQTCWANY